MTTCNWGFELAANFADRCLPPYPATNTHTCTIIIIIVIYSDRSVTGRGVTRPSPYFTRLTTSGSHTAASMALAVSLTIQKRLHGRYKCIMPTLGFPKCKNVDRTAVVWKFNKLSVYLSSISPRNRWYRSVHASVGGWVFEIV